MSSKPAKSVDGATSLASAPLECSFVVAVDQREKRPFTFTGLHADACDNHRLIEVTTEYMHLETGDYSISDGNCSRNITVERKSIEDLFNTLGKGRRRFEEELRRLAAFECAAIVIEGDWNRILNHPPAMSKLPPKIVFRSILCWTQRYPHIHWWPATDRRLAEVITFRILNRYWDLHHGNRQ